MVHLIRKLKCKYAGPKEYLPEGIPEDKFISVLGYETRRREQQKNDKTIIVEDIFFLVTNNNGKMVSIASFNCITMIDEKAEMDVHSAMELLRNISIMGKVLCEKMATKNTNNNIDQVEREDGK